MRRRARRKRRPSIKSKIKRALLEHKTFSLHIDNPNEFKVVSEMINDYLLRDYPEREKLLKFAEQLPQVKNAIHPAIKELEDEGHCVMRGPKDGRLQWITLTPNYRKAKVQDGERSLKQAVNKVTTTKKHLERSDPKIIPDFHKTIIYALDEKREEKQKLLPPNDSTRIQRNVSS